MRRNMRFAIVAVKMKENLTNKRKNRIERKSEKERPKPMNGPEALVWQIKKSWERVPFVRGKMGIVRGREIQVDMEVMKENVVPLSPPRSKMQNLLLFH